MLLLAQTMAETSAAHVIQLHWIDCTIIVAYVVLILVVGWLLSKRASKSLDAYFLGGRSLPWWVIGTSHGASGFDITGTMWFVAMLFTYGVRAGFVLWIWPLFDRVFRQVYLGPWIRRSNVLTGAEWMQTRFGTGPGGNLSHISVVVYALIACVGFLAYAFQGIGKFADVFFPWNLAWGPFTSPNTYAMIILGVTTVYLLFGGWYSVVLTDLIQFFLLSIASIFIAGVAMAKVSPEMLTAAVPDGWDHLLPDWRLTLNWEGLIDGLNTKIYGTAAQGGDGFSLFGIVVMMWLFRGLLVSAAGPTPGYGMQHQLSTRNPREAALENWWMSVVQLFPRYLMITGIAVLGVVFFRGDINTMVAENLAKEGKAAFDFEQVLPFVIRDYVPPVLVGVLMAGLLAAFMSTFDSTVNAGAAYVVNDVYKRYLAPGAANRRYLFMSRFWSVALVVVAVIVGLQVQNIHQITAWITGLLYAGYIAPNILKWHWWRFNGYGYFAGMIAGVVAALAFPYVCPWVGKTFALFFLLPISTAASVAVCLCTPPDDRRVLRKFYRDVRPWGFWGPIHEELLGEGERLEKNRGFGLDMINVANGIVWQMTLVIIPICLVIKRYPAMWAAVAVLVATSAIMKRLWYDRLEPGLMYMTNTQ